jgi:acetolactate synthase-1/2/3 large subunit
MKSLEPTPDRRGFLKGSLLLGAAGAAPATGASAADLKAPQVVSATAPNQQRIEAEVGPVHTGADGEAQVVNPGSDFMVDLMRAVGLQYIAAMPGSTFRGLQESIVNYGGNTGPELITCVHEEISAAMCHGYAKAAGKPMACLVHSNVGLQHASMAIYNAWCDKAPMMVLAGDALDAATRRPWVEWPAALRRLLHAGLRDLDDAAQ